MLDKRLGIITELLFQNYEVPLRFWIGLARSFKLKNISHKAQWTVLFSLKNIAREKPG